MISILHQIPTLILKNLSDTYTENSDDLGDLLIDKFLATLIHKIKSELRQLDKSAYRADLNKRNFIVNYPSFYLLKIIF
jgi:hypothetical protein